MKKIITFLSYIILVLYSNVLNSVEKKNLKIGLVAPLTGEYSELGNSILYSLQLALEEINDPKVFIIPRDGGFNDKQKLNSAIKEIKSQGANIIIGPINHEGFSTAKNHSDVIFISPSNNTPKFT